MVIRIAIYLIVLVTPIFVNAESLQSNINITYYQSGSQIDNIEIDLWQRELLTIKVDITTPEEFSYLKLNDSASPTDYILDSSISAKAIKISPNKYQFSILYFIWPADSKPYSLNLPSAKLYLSGKVIQSINIENINFNVKKLPDYLPPGFPVGKISMTSSYQSSSLLPFVTTTGKLTSFTLTTTSTGLHPSAIPNYRNYLTSNSIKQLPGLESPAKLNNKITFRYSSSQTIPIVTDTNGILCFNSFKVLSFDPGPGKVVSYYYSPELLISLNLIFQSLVFLVFIYIVYITMKYSIQISKNIKHRRAIWKSINHSQDANSLSSSLRSLAYKYHLIKVNPDYSPNLHLSFWASHWDDDNLMSSITLLNNLIFSNTSSVSLDEVKQTLISRLKKHESFIYYFATNK